MDRCVPAGKPGYNHLQSSSIGSFPAGRLQVRVGLNKPSKKANLFPCIKCEKEEPYEHVSVERPPYYSYMDSTSGQLEPASGARASIPGEEYWPEGTASRVRAARAPEPTGTSAVSPSYGKSPGSKRKKYKTSAAAESSQVSIEPSELVGPEIVEDITEDPKDSSSEYVIYQTEPEEDEKAGYQLDKKLGRPHPFIDPKVKKPMEEPLTSEELWWNWRKPEKEQRSRWQRR
ncbi:hypothetical protein CRYUN_Cryun31cG0055500 [Craigia yunnanensis]